MAFSKDLTKGSVVPIVLSLLSERPMYGYEIVKRVNEQTNGRLEWKEGTLYPTLHRLEARRWVKAKWAEVPSGSTNSRKRKYYHVTRSGLAELRRRKKEWQEFAVAVNAIVLGG